MSQVAQRVEQAGANMLLICANTMHRVAPTIQERLRIPVLHIADPTAQAIKARDIQTVGLLGTRFVMEQAFYRDRLEKTYGLNILLPPEAERLAVHEIIYQELVRGIITTASKRRFQEIMATLISRGAEGIILGCTEFMLLIHPDDVPVPTFDTTTLHALAAVDLALAVPSEIPSSKASQDQEERKGHSNDLSVSHMKYHTPLTKEIYGKKTIPRGCDKTAGTWAPPESM